MKQTVVRVPVWEYERGWGSKIDDYMVCLNKSDAFAYIKEFNEKNDNSVVPDWYMVASKDIDVIDVEGETLEKLKEHKRMWLSSMKKL